MVLLLPVEIFLGCFKFLNLGQLPLLGPSLRFLQVRLGFLKSLSQSFYLPSLFLLCVL